MELTDRLGLSPRIAIMAWLLVALLGGLSGIFAMLVSSYLLTFGGQDEASKHGISELVATRVGGVVVVSYTVFFLAYQYQLGRLSIPEQGWMVLVPAAAFFVVGLYEDLRASLSSRWRFLVMSLIALLALAYFPAMSLTEVGIPILDTLLSNEFGAFLFTAACLAFIPNAFNTADGANGLISGTSILALYGLSQAIPIEASLYLNTVIVGCAVFLVFNLASGRFFLGDGGAYFLGAFCGVTLILCSNTTAASTWWMLSLVFYPVADLLWSMARRALDGRSPMEPDNQHLHNLVNAIIKGNGRDAYWSNTLTGLGIVLCFGGIPLALQLVANIPLDSVIWGVVVTVQWVAYALLWLVLHRRVCAI